MKKANFFSDNPDILFQLTQRMDFQKLYDWMSPAQREALGASSGEDCQALALEMFESYGEICGEQLAPNARRVEEEGVRLGEDGEVEIPETLQSHIDTLREFGVSSFGLSPEYGGLGMPFFFEICAHELVTRACPSTGLNIVWFGAVGHIVERFGSKELKDWVLPKIVSGEWSGSMALTEPDAGSDLAAMRSYGEKQADGSWKLYGTKRFISNGNGQVSLVLAKNGKGAEGLHNLNLYLCLRKNEDGTDNFRITRLEEKLGLHGSATCELAFDGATAYLLGEPNQGFRHMLKLMNDARIGVGFQGLGLMEAVTRMAHDYASQRKTWGRPIAQHELIAERLLDMEVTTKAARSLCYQAAYNQSLVDLGEARLKREDLSEEDRNSLEQEVSRYRKRVRHWTPLIKWYVAERSVDLARENLQIHGGYGYTTEYRAEWWVRESMILPLYEGTSQIQALMCVKDTLKDVIRHPRDFIETALGLKMQSWRSSTPLRKKLYQGKELASSAVISIIMKLVKTNLRETISEVKPSDLPRLVRGLSRDLIKMENVSPALLQAERLCEMKALVAFGAALVWDAEADSSREYLAERFWNKALPRLQMLKAEIDTDEPVLASRLQPSAGEEADEPQAETAS